MGGAAPQARVAKRHRKPPAWPPATDAERAFLERCIEVLNEARVAAGWKPKRTKATSEGQCTRVLAWYREQIGGRAPCESPEDMIRAVVWAHRRVPACDGSQTDLQRIWKGDAAGKLRVVQWLEEWRDLGRPAAKAIEDKPATVTEAPKMSFAAIARSIDEL